MAGVLGSFDPADSTVHKRFEFLNTIKDSLELHPDSFPLTDGCSHFHHLRVEGQDAPSLPKSVYSYFRRALPPRFYPQIFLKSQKSLAGTEDFAGVIATLGVNFD